MKAAISNFGLFCHASVDTHEKKIILMYSIRAENSLGEGCSLPEEKNPKGDSSGDVIEDVSGVRGIEKPEILHGTIYQVSYDGMSIIACF